MKKTIIMLVVLFGMFSHADAATLKASTLRVGSTGENVKVVQQKLSELGYEVSVDGKFGRKTSEAVAKFQASQNLKADGLCGDKTFSVILNAKASSNVSSTPISGTMPTDFGTKGDTTAKGPITITPDMVWARTCADGRPHLQIINPAGGEVYQKGGNITADWKDCNIPSGAFVLAQLYSVATGYEHGTVPLTVLAGSSNLTQDDGHELFNIPSYSSAIVSGQYKLDIIVNTPNNSTPIIRTLSNIFTINAPSTAGSIQVLSPNGGETYYLGGVVNGMAVNQLPEKAKINSNKIGSIEFSLVDNASVSNPGNQYPLTSAGGFNPLINNISSSTTGLITGYPPYRTGQYYLMAKWKSNDGTENFVDFSDQSFTIIASADIDVCRNIAGIQTTVPAGMFVADGNCYSSQPVDPVKTCTQNGNGNVVISLKPYTSTSVARGAKNVLFASLDIANTSQTDICYMNGIQLGASADINNAIENIRVIDAASNAQIGQTVSNLVNNGSYYYQWVQPISVMLKKQATKSINIIADIKNNTTASSAQMGMYGINFDIGAYSSGLPIQGNPITINSIMNPRTNTQVSTQ